MSTLGITFLTAIAGAGAAFGAANFLIYWQQIPAREGQAGYFALYLTGIGVIAGLLVGLCTALAVSGFWRAQGYALGIVAALSIAGAILFIALDDNRPTLDGEPLFAEIELKFPAGWMPDDHAHTDPGSSCWIQRDQADALLEQNPIVSGEFALRATQPCEPWIAWCGVYLETSSKNRYLRVFVGKSTDLTLKLPLPGKPGRKQLDWTQWRADSFLPQKDKPAAVGHAFRVRVQKESDFKRAHP